MNFIQQDMHIDDDENKLLVPDEVQDAIRTLIEWSGDDPEREGLLDTPKRVARAWREYCQGYGEDPARHLSRQFEEVGGYDELVLLKDIPFQSHCEHHMAPITGKATAAIASTIQPRMTAGIRSTVKKNTMPAQMSANAVRFRRIA